MTAKEEEPAGSLPRLFHHRWAVPTLAALHALSGGAKFVTLQRQLDVSRDSLVRTLEALLALGLVARNPGYGHPMRPEYLLLPAGRRIAPACLNLMSKLGRLDIAELALKKWSLPLVYALATSAGRFNRLREALGDVTPRALTHALQDLQEAGIVTRLLVDDNPPRTEYALTRRGRSLLPLIRALGRAV